MLSSKVQSNDFFESIVKIYRYFGICLYGFYSSESKLKYLLFLIYQIIIHCYIITLTIPCVVENVMCYWTKTHTNSANRQIFVHLLVRNFVCLSSGFIYSFKGKQFQRLITRLREARNVLEPEIYSKVDKFRSLRRFVYLFFSVLILFDLFLMSTTYRFIKVGNANLILLTLIAELYNQPIVFATDFYLFYFSTYIKIIQTDFLNYLKRLIKIPVNDTEISLIKNHFIKIQSLTDNLSEILSPLLLIICGSIFSDIVTCSYFVCKLFSSKQNFVSFHSYASVVGIFVFTLRLCLICFAVEGINSKVNFSQKKNS
jgi:hypothetical protein